MRCDFVVHLGYFLFLENNEENEEKKIIYIHIYYLKIYFHSTEKRNLKKNNLIIKMSDPEYLPSPRPKRRKKTRGNSKTVSQYLKTGEYIRTYSSLAEASRITKTNRPYITKCAKGYTRSAGGYIWQYGNINLPKGKVIISHPSYVITPQGDIFSTLANIYLQPMEGMVWLSTTTKDGIIQSYCLDDLMETYYPKMGKPPSKSDQSEGGNTSKDNASEDMNRSPDMNLSEDMDQEYSYRSSEDMDQSPLDIDEILFPCISDIPPFDIDRIYPDILMLPQRYPSFPLPYDLDLSVDLSHDK